MEFFSIDFGNGSLAISPIPGRGGDVAADVSDITAHGFDLVVTMTTTAELAGVGADDLPQSLAAGGIHWAHLPIQDFGVPGAEVMALWPELSDQVQAILSNGGKVLFHCYGGQGRSGMAALRVMVDAGADPMTALADLRGVRPHAVETDAQMEWAMKGAPKRA